MDSNFVIATPKIYFRKDGGTMKLVKEIFQSKNGAMVLDSDLIDGPTADTHPHTPILLGH